MKARCPGCQISVRARWPRGGDGSAVIICPHPKAPADPCIGSFSVVDAPAEGPDPPAHCHL